MIFTNSNIPIVKLLHWFRSIFQTFYRNFIQKYIIFIFFVGLAAIAWYLRALSDIYVADIDYPVKYTNLPPNRMLSKEPPERLKLRVQADGYTILSSRFRYKRPLSYNVNAFALYSLTEDSTSVYTLTGYARDKLSAELGLSNKNIQILDINPDTLIFNFSRLKKKTVPVAVVFENSTGLFKNQYMLNGSPFSIPDSVIITGPSYLVDSISEIQTRSIRLRNLSDTITKKVHLQEINKITYSTNKVKAIIPVDEFTEATYDIPVRCVNVPDSLILKIFPKNVKVKYIVTLSRFNEVGPDSFHAFIDYSTIDPTLPPRLKVQLEPAPSFVYKVSISPQSVEFLIERKNAKNWVDRRDR